MEQFLTTKLYIPPTRPALVPRPCLIERLQNDFAITTLLAEVPGVRL